LARLNNDEWERLKADWCTGVYTYKQLSEQYGVSDAAIIKRKDKESWEKIPSAVVDGYIETRIETKRAIEKVSEVSKVSATNLEQSLERASARKYRAEDIGMKILESIDSSTSAVTEPRDIKELATAFKNVYEPLFKTSPDTAIQINNSNTPQVVDHSVIKSLADKLEG
jgi:hypothetical protein